MSGAATAADALRLLQQGDVAAALEASRRLIAAEPGNARAHLAAGLALRFLQRGDESLAAMREAARLDPADYGAAYELGMALEIAGHGGESLAWFGKSVALRPGFMPARHALGFALHRAGRVAEARPHLEAASTTSATARWILDHAKALLDLRRWDAAGAEYGRALRAAPDDPDAHVEFGRFCVARADYAAAADAFANAARLDPSRSEWPMYLAQVELLRGRWVEGWRGYRHREQRLRFEAQRAAQGTPYVPPALETLAGGDLTLVREQGLGDELFFLRFAPALRARGVRLAYVGDARLLPLLARTGVFESLRDIEREPPRNGERVMLTADLPATVAPAQPFAPALAIAAHGDVLARMRTRLEAAGPHPWIAVTWRSGTPRSANAEALSKEVPLEVLAQAIEPLAGSVIALQRSPRAGEIETLARALRRPVHDFCAAAEDLEEALAVASLVDRHVAVSSTSLHLAAGAVAVADVLVPFPPEWRWRSEGDSPWFPGFRIHRQDRDGGWPIRV